MVKEGKEKKVSGRDGVVERKGKKGMKISMIIWRRREVDG